MKKLLVIMYFCCVCVLAVGGVQAQAAVPLVDSSKMNLSAINAVTAKSIGSIPVGTVIAWPVSSNPEDADKWLECNGQTISQAVYPELFAVVGGSVPDFRGLFLRGVGGNSAALGQNQGDAIRNITGGIYTILSFNSTGYGAFSYSYNGVSHNSGMSGYERGGFSFDASRVVPTAEENRPANKAVRYLIRAKQ